MKNSFPKHLNEKFSDRIGRGALLGENGDRARGCYRLLKSQTLRLGESRRASISDTSAIDIGDARHGDG